MAIINKINIKETQIGNCAQTALFCVFKIDGKASKFTEVWSISNNYDLKLSNHNTRNNRITDSIYYKFSDSTATGHLEIKQFRSSDIWYS